MVRTFGFTSLAARTVEPTGIKSSITWGSEPPLQAQMAVAIRALRSPQRPASYSGRPSLFSSRHIGRLEINMVFTIPGSINRNCNSTFIVGRIIHRCTSGGSIIFQRTVLSFTRQEGHKLNHHNQHHKSFSHCPIYSGLTSYVLL